MDLKTRSLPELTALWHLAPASTEGLTAYIEAQTTLGNAIEAEQCQAILSGAAKGLPERWQPYAYTAGLIPRSDEAGTIASPSNDTVKSVGVPSEGLVGDPGDDPDPQGWLKIGHEHLKNKEPVLALIARRGLALGGDANLIIIAAGACRDLQLEASAKAYLAVYKETQNHSEKNAPEASSGPRHGDRRTR